jgi:hypothetical protein
MSYRTAEMTLLRRFSLWLRKLPGGRRLPWRYLLVGEADAADEIPRRLRHRTAVLVRPGLRQTWLIFDCPRHCSERIMLNLSRRRRPYWTIEDLSRLTVYPSVDASHGSDRCHFWLKNGWIKWV